MLERSLEEVVIGVVVDLADIHQLEVSHEVLPKDEEDTIGVGLAFCVLIIQLLLVGWRD